MNFYSIILFSYSLVAIILIYLINRDRKNHKTFFGRKKYISFSIILILSLGIILSFEARVIEPYILRLKKIEITTKEIEREIKIILVTDLQVQKNKNDQWVSKVVKKIELQNPDIVLIAGDLIDNEGTFEDESKYLEPLKNIVGKFPIYYVLGNHEYGVSANNQTGDRSLEVIKRMKKIGIPLLKNKLICPKIRKTKICIYGIDDIWGGKPSFDGLKKYYKNENPLILLTHNPDSILLWPKNIKKPNLVVAGHTHGGQIRFPFIGPLGDARIKLGRKYYYGLKKWNGVPIYVSSGVGESGGPVRLFTLPEVVEIKLKK